MADQARRWWQIAGAISRLTRASGAYPSAKEIGRAIGVSRDTARRMLGAMRSDDLVVCLGRGSEAGWRLTSEGARWREVEMPAVSVDVPRREIRSNGYRLRIWRKLQRLRASRSAHAVFESESGESVFEA